MERGAIIAATIIVLAILVWGLVFLLRGGLGPPSSAEVVAAFEDAGLAVGQSYPLEQEPGYKNSPLPKAYEEGTRFEIPYLGKNEGGRVFVFENREDLAVVRDYYKELENMPLFGPSLHSHLYDDGLVLLQINGELPKPDADRYGEVLGEEV